jgi:hypothetical protein
VWVVQMPYFLVVRRLEADKAEMEAERERWKAALLEREGDVGRIEDQMQVRRHTPPRHTSPGALLAHSPVDSRRLLPGSRTGDSIAEARIEAAALAKGRLTGY